MTEMRFLLHDEGDRARWAGNAVASGVTTGPTIPRTSGESSVAVTVKRILNHEPGKRHVRVIPEADDGAFGQAVPLAGMHQRIRTSSKEPAFVRAGVRHHVEELPRDFEFGRYTFNRSTEEFSFPAFARSGSRTPPEALPGDDRAMCAEGAGVARTWRGR
jgi:hypothetical protein